MSHTYKLQEQVYYETEYMYAALYPSGHCEITTQIEGRGIVTDIEYDLSRGAYTYWVHADDELPDGGHELFLEEYEMSITTELLDEHLDDLTHI